jgi:hypothetical protein
MVFVEFPFDFNLGSIVMPMNSFAFAVFIADEMPRTENQMIFGYSDLVFFICHAVFPSMNECTLLRRYFMNN